MVSYLCGFVHFLVYILFRIIQDHWSAISPVLCAHGLGLLEIKISQSPGVLGLNRYLDESTTIGRV